MKRLAALLTIAVALGGTSLAPVAAAREEGPIEIDKCQTISHPGSYKLVNNLTFTGTTGVCLEITADFVTIDLAGFTISGRAVLGPEPGRTNVTAIAAGDNSTGIAVRNGSISDFNTGVDLPGSGSIVGGPEPETAADRQRERSPGS